MLGAAVLAGVLVTMTALGFVMFALGQSFSRILPWLLPLTYGIVIALGVAMVLGRNPFSRLAVASTPALANPYASAFFYGGLLAPMMLPCTGPVIVSAFVLGVGSAAALAESLVYFLAFGLGFGWPLVALPLVARPLQRGATRSASRKTGLLERVAGAHVIAALVGYALPNLLGPRPNIATGPNPRAHTPASLRSVVARFHALDGDNSTEGAQRKSVSDPSRSSLPPTVASAGDNPAARRVGAVTRRRFTVS